MKDLRTIILAAGKGTRMKSSTPKVLHKICGKPLIDHVLGIARSVSSLKPCVVIGHQSEKVRKHLGDDVDIAIQKKLLGTADAVKCALTSLKRYKGDVLILCGDTPLLRKETIKELIRKHKKTQSACTFLTAVIQENQGYGRIIRDLDGKAVAIREENDATEYEKHIVEINVGIYCFKKDALCEAIKTISINKKKNEYYFTDIIEILVNQGAKISTIETDDTHEGLGVNSREDLALCESYKRHYILKGLMSKGVTIVDPQTTFVYTDVTIGQDTIIRPFSVIENNVRIGSNCIIGPFAHLRSGTKIGNNVEIGNFSEVVRAQVGDGSTMKHFCFIGDSRVGKSVNIGAGVVTANYDGTNFNKTRILDNSFVGSDSILVAPVKLGKRTTTGAGCVVTKRKNIPNKSTIMGVPGKVVSKKIATR